MCVSTSQISLAHSMTCVDRERLIVPFASMIFEQVLPADEFQHQMGRLALLDEIVDARHDRESRRATRRISASRRKKFRRMANSCGSVQIMSLTATGRSLSLVSVAR